MAKWVGVAIIVTVCMFMPHSSQAAGVADSIGGLQGILDKLYDDLMPKCEKLVAAGQGLAGFAAIFYIGSRVWRHIANAEPVDVYPLLRPFALGFCIMFFPLVIQTINGILQPTVWFTDEVVQNTNYSIEVLLKVREAAAKTAPDYEMYVGDDGEGNREQWYKFTHPKVDPSKETVYEGIGNDVRFALAKQQYKFENSIKKWMSEILNIVFQAAALCINTLRTFQLIVLSMLGPIVFGLAVFDGLQNSLTSWISRYINVFLWLPVANIFGALIGEIQKEMLKNDIHQILGHGQTYFSATDAGYLIFLLIGIVGYFMVPTVAGHMVNAGGGGAFVSKITNLASSTAIMAGSMAAGGGAIAGQRLLQTGSNFLNAGKHFDDGYSGKKSGQGAHGEAGRTAGHLGGFLHERLKGKS